MRSSSSIETLMIHLFKRIEEILLSICINNASLFKNSYKNMNNFVELYSMKCLITIVNGLTTENISMTLKIIFVSNYLVTLVVKIISLSNLNFSSHPIEYNNQQFNVDSINDIELSIEK
jgi:hypothetical protein